MARNLITEALKLVVELEKLWRNSGIAQASFEGYQGDIRFNTTLHATSNLRRYKEFGKLSRLALRGSKMI
ncbi:predicted protein [Plenodomus lingam JN3]|uniref:Predicted protein n=1 Tax=Leptosphaeria maculans (strain JN3 / isolate v23.1.3 / race Av1-4-5-6-7-8) TaxID=985895 RepID=E5A3E9_LEPMJ|nr:predicted protein [Plenodomus lingam JN3]CBX98162.1 predicted protein [Plenodomus lingam JN3]